MSHYKPCLQSYGGCRNRRVVKVHHRLIGVMTIRAMVGGPVMEVGMG